MTILEHVRIAAEPHVNAIVLSRREPHTSDDIAAGAHAVARDEQQIGESLATPLSQWLDKQTDSETMERANDTSRESDVNDD